jgi:hypothetical protein
MAQAADDYAALLQARHRLLGDSHPDTLRTLGDLAHWLAETAHARRGLGIEWVTQMQQAPLDR